MDEREMREEDERERRRDQVDHTAHTELFPGLGLGFSKLATIK